MVRFLAFLFAFVLLAGSSIAQTNAPSAAPPKPAATDSQSAIDQLTQSNRDLLDLLKKQQGVLEDIQYDRRIQSRQIQSLEERLSEALQDNAKLQSKVAELAAAASNASKAGPAPATPPADTNTAHVVEQPPAPPETYLPKPESVGAPGTKSWHRLFTLKGNDVKTTDIFHIEGRTWRVLWHNQDKPGKSYENTSALFVSAFPKDDVIPQKVCSKLGTGGDSSELAGPGNYYLKIEASGGSWELAVEDFK